MTKTIGFLVGSLRDGSFTRKVAEAYQPLFPEGYKIKFIEIDDVPFYNQDLDIVDDLPGVWKRLREDIADCDGYGFFTPEYNRSIPPALKNALDVASRAEKNPFDGKPGFIVSVSPSRLGGFGANHHLRQVLVWLNVLALAQPEAYYSNIMDSLDKEGNLKPEAVKRYQKVVDAYVKFADKF
ncbi:MAG: NAD(P)H-dependent oxidoreductase [Enterococcaceae bacterium]|jgi:chromate reductase|nr:NAD(P)H-dependent oxidoreductase [Enterococcaceae bacterium]MCI1919999.1 NAD(P)H-dependent oxidoreductase [Enterococcaceae bacterium]